MELTIKKTDLVNSLTKVSGSVQKHVILESGEKLSLSSSDDKSATISTCNSEAKKEGVVCVEFSRLMSFSKNYSGDEIKLKTTKAGWLNIEGKNVKIRLPGVNKDDYPVVSFEDLENKIKADHTEIKNAINMTHHAIGQNKAREGLMGLNIRIESGKMIFTAGDERIISRYVINCDSETEANILIPEKTAAEIEKLIDESSVISYDENRIQIESENLKYKSSLMNAHFPNIDQLMNEKQNQVKVNRESLNDMINILTAVASAEKDPIVKFILNDNKIKIESKRLDTGDGDGFIDCEYQGEEKSIGFNLTFLKKGMTAINMVKDENVIFHFDSKESPVLLTTKSLENYKAVVMPVRIMW